MTTHNDWKGFLDPATNEFSRNPTLTSSGRLCSPAYYGFVVTDTPAGTIWEGKDNEGNLVALSDPMGELHQLGEVGDPFWMCVYFDGTFCSTQSLSFACEVGLGDPSPTEK